MRTRLDEERRRYELFDGEDLVGRIDFIERPGVLDMVRVEVDPSRRGQGLAAVLAAAALTDVRERGLSVIPSCPYLLGYLRGHPDQVDLVPRELRAGLGLADGADGRS